MSGLVEIFSEELKIPVYIADDALTSVARGTGVILENLEEFEDLLVPNEDEIPPKK